MCTGNKCTRNDNLGRNGLKYAIHSSDGRSAYVGMAQCEAIRDKSFLCLFSPILLTILFPDPLCLRFCSKF